MAASPEGRMESSLRVRSCSLLGDGRAAWHVINMPFFSPSRVLSQILNYLLCCTGFRTFGEHIKNIWNCCQNEVYLDAFHSNYRVDGVDVAQETERNEAAARHSWARQHTWLLLRFSPFLERHTLHPLCKRCNIMRPPPRFFTTLVNTKRRERVRCAAF